MNTNADRRVVANISLSLDGRVNGPGGDYDMNWIVPHALTDTARDHMVRVTGTATTAVLGRKNYQGFSGFWPAVADNENADPRDRAFSAWLNAAQKVVFSTSLPTSPPAALPTSPPAALTESPWQGTTQIVAGDPAEEVRKLRAQDGGDIIVLASSSIIRALLAADEVDRLSITLCPAVAGGGARLFEDGLPASDWTLADLSTTDSGAICALYDRTR